MIPFGTTLARSDGCKPDSVRSDCSDLDGHFSQKPGGFRPSCDKCDVTRGFVRPLIERRSRRPLPLFCLAPHRVFHAPEIALRAVGSYPAFSPLPRSCPQVTFRLSSWRFVFCDTLRRRELSRPPPAYSTRYAAVWCPDFPLGLLPAVVRRHRQGIYTEQGLMARDGSS